MLCREIKATYFKNHTEHTNTLRGQYSNLLLLNLTMHIVTSRLTGLIYCNTICCNIILCNTILIVTEASGWKWSLVPRHYKHIKNVIICNEVNFRHYLRIACLKTPSVNSDNAASTVFTWTCHFTRIFRMLHTVIYKVLSFITIEACSRVLERGITQNSSLSRKIFQSGLPYLHCSMLLLHLSLCPTKHHSAKNNGEVGVGL